MHLLYQYWSRLSAQFQYWNQCTSLNDFFDSKWTSIQIWYLIGFLDDYIFLVGKKGKGSPNCMMKGFYQLSLLASILEKRWLKLNSNSYLNWFTFNCDFGNALIKNVQHLSMYLKSMKKNPIQVLQRSLNKVEQLFVKVS